MYVHDPGCFVILLCCCIVIFLCSHIGLFCCIVILLCCCIVILSCCHIALSCCIIILLCCSIVILVCCCIVLLCWWCSYCNLLCCCLLMILFVLPNISRCAQVHNGTERMLACRARTSGWDIRHHCFWWGVWWESTQLDVNFLGNVWLGTNHAKRYMHKMQQHYCKGGTIQQTLDAISRITSWGNPNKPEVHTQWSHWTLPYWARGPSQLWLQVLLQEDISNTTHSNKSVSHHLMHCTRTQDEWWHQNHFGSRLSCMGLESVYYFWITWRNGGFEIQPHWNRNFMGQVKLLMTITRQWATVQRWEVDTNMMMTMLIW
jgi:hypothetical protein